jgi:MFS family permease
MFFVRWIPTFLAFPLAGLLAMFIVGPNQNPLTALAVGAIAGAVIGAAQWLALGRLTDWRWAVGTLVAVIVGSTLSMLVVGPAVTPLAATITGLITGIAVGAAQGVVLRRTLRDRLRVVLIWTATVGASWAVAWLITSFVIVDLNRGHAVFGSSGAIIATVATGIVLRLLLGARARRAPRHTAKAVAAGVGTGKGE